MDHWKAKPQPPFNDHLGITVEEWREGFVKISAQVLPHFQNSQGAPHGGFIMSMADIAASFPGVFCPHEDRRRFASTLSLNTNFLGVAKTPVIFAEGRVTTAGRKIFYSQVDIYDAETNPVASCQGVFRYRGGSEHIDGVAIES